MLLLLQYFIEPLKQLSIKKFEGHCEAQRHSPEFAEAAEALYDAGLHRDSDLKQIVINTIKTHAKELLVSGGKEGHNELQAVMGQTELGLDVSHALVGTGTFVDGKTYKCPGCSIKFTAVLPLCCRITCPKGCYSNNNYQAGWWASNQV